MEEYKVGEVFQFGKKKLKCVDVLHNNCTGCFLYGFDDCVSCIGECSWAQRSDRKNVVFIEVTEEENRNDSNIN